ncbi:MAG: formate/nitrite transporter family protein [Candidatus Omnitrophica bacterium]|nr:formate/nitrite transporter family protein [Candidatus Omnitrophota bacterium]
MAEVTNFGCNPPAGIAKALSEVIGVKKANGSIFNLTILGIFAGVYIGFGAALATLVSSDLARYVGVGLTKVITGGVFSVGLMLVILAGAELFTGNNLMLMSVLDKKVALNKVLGKWALVYIANLIGSVLLAYMMYKSDLWKGGGFLTGIQALKIANAKVNLTFGAAFFRAIACNWLVCLAVWLALSARTTVGRIFAIFFPIMTFVALGFEHCIANMYFIPMGLFLKGTEAAAAAGLNLTNLNLGGFLVTNLIPVTIGNIIGGAFFVGTLYWSVYLKQK